MVQSRPIQMTIYHSNERCRFSAILRHWPHLQAMQAIYPALDCLSQNFVQCGQAITLVGFIPVKSEKRLRYTKWVLQSNMFT